MFMYADDICTYLSVSLMCNVINDGIYAFKYIYLGFI